jgi:Protein DA1
MTGIFRSLLGIFLVVGLASSAYAFRCEVCGREIYGQIFIVTDHVTDEKKYVCAECVRLPRCYICGIPVKNGTTLPDGRSLCDRDAKTAVLDAGEAKQVCIDVENELNHTYSRFTEFPADVEVSVIDRIDVDSMGSINGNAAESPDILGVYHLETSGTKSIHHVIRLLTGQPADRLRNVSAHELSHAWVRQNVPEERHARLSRDAEEGFCEMMAYLLMQTEGDEAEKKRILANAYTRGQVKLFIDAEQQFGFQQVLDWMQYGETGRLEEDHLERIRDVKMPPSAASKHAAADPIANKTVPAPPRAAPANLELESVLWGNHPMAIINRHPFAAGDESRVNVGKTNATIRCLAIQTNSVHIRNLGSGQEQDLFLSK